MPPLSETTRNSLAAFAALSREQQGVVLAHEVERFRNVHYNVPPYTMAQLEHIMHRLGVGA